VSGPQFTSGPWHTHRSERTDHKGVEINDPVGLTVAYAVKFVPQYAASSAANANLIAASPSLFQALEKALPYIDAREDGIYEEARAALAKARGESQ
jgi:hypothetical protein